MREGEGRAFLPIYASVFLSTLGLAVSMYFVPIYVQQVGGGYLEVGLAGTARSAPYAIIPFFLAKLAEKSGLLKLYIFGLILGAVSLLLLPFFPNPYFIVGLMALSGISMAFFWPPSEAAVASLARKDLSKYIGYYSFSWASAFFLGPYFGGLLSGLGFWPLFTVSGLLFLVGLIPLKWLNIGEGKLEEGKLEWNPYALGVVVPYAILFGVMISIYPAYASKLGFDNLWVGLLFSAFGFLRMVGFYLVKYVERIKIHVLAASCATMIAFGILIAYTKDPLVHLALFMVYGLAMGFFFPISLEMVVRMGEGPVEGVGTFEGFFGVGFILGPALGGLLASYEESLPYLIFGLLMALPLSISWRRS